jgi:tRNA(Ile)-lysidine synthase
VYLLYDLHARGLPVTVLHVNHELRGGDSDDDERFVQSLAESLGLSCLVHHAPVGDGNLEQEAREARYGWFRSLIREGAVAEVALGHTQSDQAETVIFRFLRGAGTSGLAGIRPRTKDGLFRPLLSLTREEIRDSLHSRGIPWREDASNSNLDFARNRIRCELLPLLTRDWNPALSKSLAQTADWALAEESYWDKTMARLARKFFRGAPPDLLVRWPGSLPLAVQRRLIRHALRDVKGDLLQIEFGHVEAIRTLRSGRLSLPGLEVERSFEWLRIARPGPRTNEINLNIRLELLSAESVYNENKHQLDWGLVSGPLALRTWRPGDRYQRVGRPKEERLKLLFQKARIPVWERRSWPVLLCGNSIAWTREFGAAAGLGRTGTTRIVLLIHDLSGFPNRNL